MTKPTSHSVDPWFSKAATLLAAVAIFSMLSATAHAQLLGEPPIPSKQSKQKNKKQGPYTEWLWQYSPPPAGGREHELIQDQNFQPFLEDNFATPQSFWGPNPTDPKAPTHKSLATTIYDFLTIPGEVIADDNRYVTVTGAVFHRRTERGLLFADLNGKDPLLAFAAIDWISSNKTTDDPDAEYTLWIFPNKPLFAPALPGSGDDSAHLPPPLLRSITRWMTTPVPGTTFKQKITAAIMVDPDGTPHQIAVPNGGAAPTEAKPLPKRSSP